MDVRITEGFKLVDLVVIHFRQRRRGISVFSPSYFRAVSCVILASLVAHKIRVFLFHVLQ